MENPSSWNRATKVINECLYKDTVNTAHIILYSLMENDLLKETNAETLKNFEVSLSNEMERIEKFHLDNPGFCGQSMAGQLHNYLVKHKVI